MLIDTGPLQSVACSAGATAGVLVPNLTAGSHAIELSARDSNGLAYYRTVSSFNVTAGGAATQQFSLAWIVGSAPVKWTFSNGVTQLTCAQAGVFDVGITLRDANGDTTFTSPCLNGGVQGYQVPYVYYGTYQIFLAATGTGGVIYRSSSAVPPTFEVRAGEFPNVDNPVQTPAILLTP